VLSRLAATLLQRMLFSGHGSALTAVTDDVAGGGGDGDGDGGKGGAASGSDALEDELDEWMCCGSDDSAGGVAGDDDDVGGVGGAGAHASPLDASLAMVRHTRCARVAASAVYVCVVMVVALTDAGTHARCLGARMCGVCVQCTTLVSRASQLPGLPALFAAAILPVFASCAGTMTHALSGTAVCRTAPWHAMR
jgi:hypothetical protein